MKFTYCKYQSNIFDLIHCFTLYFCTIFNSMSKKEEKNLKQKEMITKKRFFFSKSTEIDWDSTKIADDLSRKMIYFAKKTNVHVEFSVNLVIFSSTIRKMILRSIKIQNFLIILLTEVIRYKYTHIKMYAFIYAIYYAFFLLLLLFCAFCFVQLISCTFNKTSKFNSPHLMRPCICQNHTYVPMRMLFLFKSE